MQERERDRKGHTILNFVFQKTFLSTQPSVRLFLFPCCLCFLLLLLMKQLRFSRYKNLIHFKVTPTLRFKFYFPPINNNKMADAHIFRRQQHQCYLHLGPKMTAPDSEYCTCVTVILCCSAKFLLTGRKRNFVLVWKCQ